MRFSKLKKEKLLILLSHHKLGDEDHCKKHCIILMIKNNKIPLCARCFGFYTSALITLVFLSIFGVRVPHQSLPIWLAMGFLTLIDWSLYKLTSREISASRRFFISVFSGAGFMVTYKINSYIAAIGLEIAVAVILVINLISFIRKNRNLEEQSLN